MKYINITDHDLIGLKEAIKAICTHGDGCFKVVGVINFIDSILQKEEANGNIHAE